MTDPLADLRGLIATMEPEELEQWAAGLDSDDLVLVEHLVAEQTAMGWRANPATFAAHLTADSPDPYQLWPYAVLLAQKFADAVEGRSNRQIWNLAAQYGKSLAASQWGPAWALDRYPDRRFILASYGDELADRNALAVRDILDRHPEELRARLRRDQRRADRFSTPEGGGILAAGVGSAITGFGAHGVIVDDPFKNWQEAHSAARRLLVWNAYRSVLRLRLTSDDAFVIVVQTRWHADDLTGRLIEASEKGTGERWEIVRLPEVAEPTASEPDPLGREAGEVLEPRRFSPAAVAAKQLSLGSYLWAGMAQQRPAPEEGVDLLRAWFKIEPTAPTAPDDSCASWDLKLKDREQGDYVVGQAWWRVAGGYWLMDQIRGGFDHATTANAIALLAVRHPEITSHVVESAGSADEVLPMLRKADPDYVVTESMASRLGMNLPERVAVQELRRRGMTGIIPNPAKGSKEVRARAYIAPTAEAGDVHLLASSAFVPLLLDEVAAFPNGSHDDQVDAMSQALQRLARLSRATVRKPEGRLPQGTPSGPSSRKIPQRSAGGRARIVTRRG